MWRRARLAWSVTLALLPVFTGPVGSIPIGTSHIAFYDGLIESFHHVSHLPYGLSSKKSPSWPACLANSPIAPRRLEDEKLRQVSYGSITFTNVDALRAFAFESENSAG